MVENGNGEHAMQDVVLECLLLFVPGMPKNYISLPDPVSENEADIDDGWKWNGDDDYSMMKAMTMGGHGFTLSFERRQIPLVVCARK